MNSCGDLPVSPCVQDVFGCKELRNSRLTMQTIKHFVKHNNLINVSS